MCVTRVWLLFNTEPRDWLGRTSPVVCRVGRKTVLHSVQVTFTTVDEPV